MCIDKVKEVADRIRRLEVQGATNIGLIAVQSLVEQVKLTKSSDRAAILSEIAEARSILFKSRATEPFMRNAIRYIEWKVKEGKWQTVEELKKLIDDVSKNFIERLKKARDRIIEILEKMIKLLRDNKRKEYENAAEIYINPR